MNSITRLALGSLAAAAVLAVAAVPANAQPLGPVQPSKPHAKTEIEKTRKALNSRFAQASRSISSWGEDPQTKTVVVNVLASDKAAQAKAKAAIKDLPAAQIVLIDELPKPLWNVIGGQAITTSTGARCSIGFTARNSAGTRYAITAGHCTELGGTWTGAGGALGPVAGTSFPTNDYGRIQITSSAAVSTALVDRYTSGSDVTVTGVATATPGTGVCRIGSTTGWRCGFVNGTNQTVNYGGGDIVSGLTRTTACAQPGDSGGAYVTSPGSGSTRVSALGVLSGGSGNCSSGGTTFYQPINEILSAYGLTLVTG